MKEVEFPLFISKKHNYPTINTVVYSSLAITTGIHLLNHNYFHQEYITSLTSVLYTCVCISMLYFGIVSSFMKPLLLGSLDKKILFTINAIQINTDYHLLSTIKKIEFFPNDYYDRLNTGYRYNLNPLRTHGVSNLCILTFENGSSTKSNFQLMSKTEFQKMRELLISYHFDDKIHFLALIEYLKINKYEEIQAFKAELLILQNSK